MYHTHRLTSLVLIVIPEYLMMMICMSTKTFYLHSYINESGYSEYTAGRGLSPTDMICTVYGYRYHTMSISVHLDFSHLNPELSAVCSNIPSFSSGQRQVSYTRVEGGGTCTQLTNVDKNHTCLCWSHDTIVTCHVFGEEEKRLGV